MTGVAPSGPTAAMMPDGERLHMQHGPIDLLVRAYGAPEERRAAYRQAAARFRSVLDELVGELSALRRPVDPNRLFSGAIAQRMQTAALPHSTRFITPMASVAGAVADEIMDSLLQARTLRRAYVNNGGDIALHLGDGACFDAAIVTDPVAGTCGGRARVCADDGVRGVATSGRHGRSHSFGIADAVTVLAGSAAAADAAATMIANAVDLPGSPGITRLPANQLDPNSDLADRPVTVAVADLTDFEVDAALAAGLDYAETLLQTGEIRAAFLSLAGRSRTATGPGDGVRIQIAER